MADSLPLFPLQAVLLPGANMPLHIFEPRYRQLTVDLITGTVPDRRFGIVAMRPSAGHEVTDCGQVHVVGCSAALRQAKRLPDGRFDIVTTGERRFRLLSIDATSAPYLIGSVDWVPDLPSPAAPRRAIGMLADAARAAHRRYCAAAWQEEDWSEPAEDIGIADLAHALAADCLLSIADRQSLLEETRPLHRLRLIGELLNREAGLLSHLRAVPAPPSEFSTPFSLN